MASIKLKRAPTRRDHDLISLAAQKPCECEIKTDLDEGAVCKPCAARSILNGIVTLAEELGVS